tara:strand:- start:8 stop:172 length:165 start_codon:yes stop_codon:yes gene_type:complete
MRIKDLVTPEQYIQLKAEYTALVKNNEITFFQFCTETFIIDTQNGVSRKSDLIE